MRAVRTILVRRERDKGYETADVLLTRAGDLVWTSGTDQHGSVVLARPGKPHKLLAQTTAYRLVLDAVGEATLVAAHAWDCAGALRAGAALCTANVALSLLVGRIEGDPPADLSQAVIWAALSGVLAVALFSLGAALNRLATRGGGNVAKDLTRVCGRIRQGLTEVEALREWADVADVEALHRQAVYAVNQTRSRYLTALVEGNRALTSLMRGAYDEAREGFAAELRIAHARTLITFYFEAFLGLGALAAQAAAVFDEPAAAGRDWSVLQQLPQEYISWAESLISR